MTKFYILVLLLFFGCTNSENVTSQLEHTKTISKNNIDSKNNFMSKNAGDGGDGGSGFLSPGANGNKNGCHGGDGGSGFFSPGKKCTYK